MMVKAVFFWGENRESVDVLIFAFFEGGMCGTKRLALGGGRGHGAGVQILWGTYWLVARWARPYDVF